MKKQNLILLNYLITLVAFGIFIGVESTRLDVNIIKSILLFTAILIDAMMIFYNNGED